MGLRNTLLEEANRVLAKEFVCNQLLCKDCSDFFQLKQQPSISSFNQFHSAATSLVFILGNVPCFLQFLQNFVMATQNTTLSFKDKIAMFEKFTGGSAPAPPQKKQTIAKSTNPIPNTSFQANNSSNKFGEVESPPIVKPTQFQSLHSSGNSNGSPGKLGSTNNPWLQQNSTGTPAWVKHKPENQHSNNNKPSNKTQEATKFALDKMVKITENAVVDKESLPSQNAMKLLFEGRLIGLKRQESSPIKINLNSDHRQPPKQAPVIQTDLKLQSVKESTNKYNQFFQARESQKLKAEQQAKQKKEAEQLPHQTLKLKQTQSEITEEPSIQSQNNSQNVLSATFSYQPQQTVSITQSNVLNLSTSQENTLELSIPIGAQSIPFKEQSTPLEKVSIAIREESISVGEESIPIGEESIPIGEESIPIGEESIPVGESQKNSDLAAGNNLIKMLVGKKKQARKLFESDDDSD